MSARSLASPFPVFTDIDGNPLEDGYIYIGTAGLNPEANPIQAYWDAALSIPAAQPIRTLGGYPSRSGAAARIYVNADDCSLLVRNKNGSLIFSSVNQTDAVPSGMLTFSHSDTNAAGTVGAKLALSVCAKDAPYNATGDGVTDDTAAIQAAIDAVNAAGGGEVYLPAGTYNIGANTLVMKSQVILRGDGTQATIIKSSSYVLDYGSWAAGGTQNAKLIGLQLYCTGAAGCIALRGRVGGASVTGDLWAHDVYFNGDQSIVIDEAHFYYSGFWNIDKCIFKKYLHLSTSSNLNGDGTGMLINTVRILNSTFGTDTYADYAIKLASVANPTGVNQTLIKGCVFERTNSGGIYYLGGNQHAFEDNWFADGTANYYTIDIGVNASFVSVFNVFDRGSGNTQIRNLSAGPVSIKNCNVLTGTGITAPVSAGTLPRVALAHSPLVGPLLHCLNQDGNGDIYLSSRKLQGCRAINILLPPTAALGTIAIPVPAEYVDSQFKRIIAWKLRCGDTAIADPGATYTVGIRLRYYGAPTTLLSWTNANVSVTAFSIFTLNDSGVFNGTDFTNYLDTTARNGTYIDIIKNGAGAATGYMYVTLYVM